MKITTFKNMKAMIHGKDPKRIGCAMDGVLKIGTTEIPISATGKSILPVLFYGGTGDYDATFIDKFGKEYKIEKVAVRNGRIDPPSRTEVEIMELRCRADIAEDECEALHEKIRVLENIFDTNSLNFLIK